MELDLLRTKIDDIDEKIVKLLKERLSVAEEIGKEKKRQSLPIENLARETEILDKVSSEFPKEVEKEVKEVYQTIFTLSKKWQER